VSESDDRVILGVVLVCHIAYCILLRTRRESNHHDNGHHVIDGNVDSEDGCADEFQLYSIFFFQVM
jgi:hypothetical protein